MLGRPAAAQPQEVVRDGDLIPDSRLAPEAEDLLDHDAIARGVAEIAWTAEAPVNIALFGAWGSGKSSVYSMIEQHLDRIAPKQVKVARYDAWKYGGRELKRNFIDSLAVDLELDEKPAFSEGLEQDQVDTRLHTLKWVRDNWVSLLVGVGLAAVVVVLWVVVQAVAAVVFTDEGFKATAKSLIPQAGTVFGLALVAALVGSKVIEGAVVTTTTQAPEGSDQFARRFRQLVQHALRGKPKRLVVFIDELDRCDPKDVVATLIDLKTFLDQDDCVFIVAADREVIERALRQIPQAKPVREDEPYYATSGAFLDKIFQHQLALPPLRSRALTNFAHDLVDDQGGIWAELRSHGQDTFDRTVFALVPVHVRSPRRVKVLLNNFATNARIAQSRRLGWIDRAHEIAVLTVLQTEFPAVAEDLRRVPRLMVYLREEDVPSSTEVRDVVARYSLTPRSDVPQKAAELPAPAGTTAAPPADPESTETAAGRLLSDDETPEGVRERLVASLTLRRHLANYLDKVAAAGIRDPRPDLLYLQSAGSRESLTDPRLGDAIDFATDTAPDSVVHQFADEPSATLAIAIPLLVIEGDNVAPPGRTFAYEAACKLVERLDPDDFHAVAQEARPSLVGAARIGALSEASLPGALLVACWSGDAEVVSEVLATLRGRRPSEGLLDSLTILLPHLGADERGLLVGMLADQFEETPQPLLTALRDAPVEIATKLWTTVEDHVVDVLNALELPPVEPGPESAAPVTRTAQTATTALPAAPEPTGVGVERLEEAVEAVRIRSDHEPLLSAVLATFQSQAVVGPLRAWVANNADQLIGTMSSPALHARHAMLGLLGYPNGDWGNWLSLLPIRDGDDPPSGADEVNWLADKLLNDVLVPAFTSVDENELGTLPGLAGKVASWSSISEADLKVGVRAAISTLGWEAAAEDDATGHLLWARKAALLETASALASDDESPLYAPFVEDLAALLTTVSLTVFVIENWQELCARLPVAAAKELSRRVDEYDPAENEHVAVLRVKLAVRAVFSGAAPAAAELAIIPAEELSTAVTDAWLALSPHLDEEARALLASEVPFSPASVRRYCATLDTEERTDVWVTLARNSASEGLLTAAGAAGLGPAAVEYVRDQVKGITREPDRSTLVARLRAAHPAGDVDAGLKKATSELASDLLVKGTAGDLRTAAELVLWARGAGYGHTQALRQQFTDQVRANEKALPKSMARDLDDIGLLNVPRKGILATLLGR